MGADVRTMSRPDLEDEVGHLRSALIIKEAELCNAEFEIARMKGPLTKEQFEMEMNRLDDPTLEEELEESRRQVAFLGRMLYRQRQMIDLLKEAQYEHAV